MWTVTNKTGRLVEARLGTPFRPGEMDKFALALAQEVVRSKDPVVGIADFTYASIFTQADSDRLIRLMRSDNPRVERTALVISDVGTIGLQMERVINAAGPDRRRVFREQQEAIDWLSEVLSHWESLRLRVFLNERWPIAG